MKTIEQLQKASQNLSEAQGIMETLNTFVTPKNVGDMTDAERMALVAGLDKVFKLLDKAYED